MSQTKRIALYGLLLFFTALLLLFPYHPEQISHADEGFYIQTPREMIKTDDYLIPKYNGQLRFQKPVLYYWLVAVAYNIFGESERAARFTSTFFGALTLLIIFIALSHWKSINIALLSALGIVSTYGFFSLSHYAITDITLNAFIAAALLLYWRIYKKENSNLIPSLRASRHCERRSLQPPAASAWVEAISSSVRLLRRAFSPPRNDEGDPSLSRNDAAIWIFFALVALAFLTKGPPGLFIPLLTITLFTLFTRDHRGLKPLGYLSGWWIFISIALPWFLVLYGFFRQDYVNFFIHGESITRFTQNHRSALYLLASYMFLITPWVLFLPLLFNFKTIKENSFYLFLLSWIIAPLLFFLIIPNKHSHYLLPSVVPSIILLISLALEQKNTKYFLVLHKLLFFGLIAALCIAITGLSFVTPILENSRPLFVLTFLMLLGIVSIYFLKKDPSAIKITLLISILSLSFLFTIHFLVIPSISRRPEDGFAKKIKEEPFAKAISYRWHTKRLLYILSDRRVSFAVDDDDLERELIWPGPTYVIVDSVEYKRIAAKLKTKLDIIDRGIVWNKKVNASKVISRLAARDYDAFKAELLLLRRR